MTPKEKAEQLLNLYYPIVNGGEQYNWVFKKSKECALIACEFAKESPLFSDVEINYINEIIKEIELL